MRLNFLDVVEISLPVFYDTILISREQPVIRVRIGDASNCGFMGLHDGFKVEAHAIPQGELSASGTCEQSAAVGCPFDHIYRMLDFI
jgi:hypothetical protein